jgi:hypothetical protein
MNFPGTNVPLTKDLIRKYKLECKSFPAELLAIPKFQWPKGDSYNSQCQGVWRSREYAVFAWMEPGKSCLRLTFQKTEIDRQTGRWRDGLTWDTMMKLKDEAGYGDHWAVEVYPPREHVVDVVNLRHIWLLNEKPDYAWNNK